MVAAVAAAAAAAADGGIYHLSGLSLFVTYMH